MDFAALMQEYKEGTSIQSPIWIWFTKEKDGAQCNICQSHHPMKSFSTSNLIFHLKRHHGFLKKYNAWKEYEELSLLKEERLKCKHYLK